MMATFVFVLCGLTSLACSALLLPLRRGRDGVRRRALFFLRFWQRTKDLLFSASFFILARSDTFFALEAASPAESRPLFYLPRFVAYALILAAIAVKNRKLSS
jgi:Trk-type K+ transport system membrane component